MPEQQNDQKKPQVGVSVLIIDGDRILLEKRDKEANHRLKRLTKSRKLRGFTGVIYRSRCICRSVICWKAKPIHRRPPTPK